MMFVLYNNNTIGITGRAGNANRSRAHEFIPTFTVVSVAQGLVFFVVYCRLLFVLF